MTCRFVFLLSQIIYKSTACVIFISIVIVIESMLIILNNLWKLLDIYILKVT